MTTCTTILVVFLLVAVGTITNALSIVRQNPTQSSLFRKTSHSIYDNGISRSSSSTILHVSMDSSVAPEHSDKEMKSSNRDKNSDDDDWTPIRGGFIPNFLRKIRPKRNVHLVDNLMDYKNVVVDEPEKLVVVRFFATWCRSCKASETHFRKLVSKFSPDVKFVEVPLTKETAYMLDGLDVKSVPFAHIYHPEAGLVEEMRASKRYSSQLQKKLLSYVVGSCHLEEEESSTKYNRNDTPMITTSSGTFE